MVAILDYGIGNISSIFNMLRKISVPATITSDSSVIGEADRLLLPGVGHFDYCMQQLKKAPFFDILQERVMEDRVPVLGVCVGCQMLMERSEEGKEAGLGWIRGEVVKFKISKMAQPLKIPHMGWTDVEPIPGTSIYEGIAEPRFYFVHSYHVECENPEIVSGRAVYGYPFAASVKQDHIQGVQFHPEKSHRFGMKLYQNFTSQ